MFTYNKIKKYCTVTLLLFFGAMSANGQTFDSIRNLFSAGNLPEAKQAIDDYLAKQRKDSRAQLLKAEIYFAFTKHPKYSALIPNGASDAMLAIKQALLIDSNLTKLTLKEKNYILIDDLVNSFMNSGIIAYNAGKENNITGNYETSFYTFQKADQANNILKSERAFSAKNDSNLMYYLALSAIESKREDIALGYIGKIRSARIIATEQNDFMPVYKWWSYYWLQKADKDMMQYVTGICSDYYPQENYFILNYIAFLRKNEKKEAVLAYLRDEITQKTDNCELRKEYIRELLTCAYSSDSISTGEKEKFLGDLEKQFSLYDDNCPKVNAEVELFKATDQFNQAAIGIKQLNKSIRNGRLSKRLIRQQKMDIKIKFAVAQNILTNILLPKKFSAEKEILDKASELKQRITDYLNKREVKALLSLSILLFILFNIILIIGNICIFEL